MPGPTPLPTQRLRSTKPLVWTFILVAVVLATAWAVWRLSNARCVVLTGSVTCRVETTHPFVALTFDDGPTDLGIRAVLPVLNRYDAKATFFLIGSQLEARPDLARQLLAAGHEIGNHSYSHERMIFKTSRFYVREVEQTDAQIHAVGGKTGLFRPPYAKKLIGLPRAVARSGLRMVTWDVEDPTTDDPALFARDIVEQARPGSIILIHPMYQSNETARRALPAILQGLKAKGLQPVTMSKLLHEAAS